MQETDSARRVLYKRWRLRPDVTPDQVAEFVVERIMPEYRRLSPDVELGLELLADRTAVLAIQRWRDRSALERALGAPTYPSWLAEYQPVLEMWHEIVDFDVEWETTELAV
jgi:hypothetical protein